MKEWMPMFLVTWIEGDDRHYRFVTDPEELQNLADNHSNMIVQKIAM
jgi:hypothetical protein